MRLIPIIVLLSILLTLAGCGDKAATESPGKVALSVSLQQTTLKDGATTGLVMTARNTGEKAIVGASFDVVPEDPKLVIVSYASRKDFTLAPGESITKIYTVEGFTKIRASEVLLSINLTAPGIGEYVSLGNAQVALRIEK